MAYVITGLPVSKILFCVDVCPTDCIHPKHRVNGPVFEEATQLFVRPRGRCYRLRGLRVPPAPQIRFSAVDDVPRINKPFPASSATPPFFKN